MSDIHRQKYYMKMVPTLDGYGATDMLPEITEIRLN